MSKKNRQANFIQELEILAERQSHLNNQHILPHQLDFVSSVVGNYPWQSLLVLSGLTTVIGFVIKQIK